VTEQNIPISTGIHLDLVVLDCPNPRALAEFYARLLGWEIVRDSPDWVTIRDTAQPAATGMAFQLAPEHVAPTWPDPRVPQQSHLDLDVADLDIAEREVLAAGATVTGMPSDGTTDFRVYLDPAGHPFCLCLQ
jgi:predicted enzyme related to lactoylglutathione lyase